MILRQKACNQFVFLVRKAKHDCSCRAKHLALTFWWPLTKQITGIQYHHKLMLYSSCHVPRRVLGGATKVEQGTIRVGGERLLVITGDLIATTVTQRATSCHYRWWQLIALWATVIDIKALVITRRVMWRPGWMLKNRGQLRWIDDLIIQWKRNRYHR